MHMAFLRHLVCGVDSHDPEEQAGGISKGCQKIYPGIDFDLSISNRAAHRLWYLPHNILVSYSIRLKHRRAWELLAQARFSEAVFSCVCFLSKCPAFRGSIPAVSRHWLTHIMRLLS